MLLSTQLALAAAQQPVKSSSSSSSPSAFLSAYVSMLNNSSLLSSAASSTSLLSEKLKASRFSPYSKPDFKTITSSAKVKTPTEVKNSVIQEENVNVDNNHLNDEAET